MYVCVYVFISITIGAGEMTQQVKLSCGPEDLCLILGTLEEKKYVYKVVT